MTYRLAIALLLLSLPACKKEEKVEPTPAAPVTRAVRYHVQSLGSYQFTFRVNGVGADAVQTGDTMHTVQLTPGTYIELGTDGSTAAVTARIWLDNVLQYQEGAPAGQWVYIHDTIP